jgi:hypothetical protein
MADQATQAMLAAMLGGGGSLRGLSDIGAFQQELDNNDMFKALAVPIAQTKFDTSTWSPGTTAGVTAAQAFLSGILGELSKREQAEQMFKVAQVLPQLYEDPRAVSMPEGIDPQAFGKLKLEAVRGNLMRDLERKEKVNDLYNSLFTKKFEAGFDLDKAIELEERKAGLAGNIERAKTRGALEGKQDVYGKLGIDAVEDPESPLFKANEARRSIATGLRKELAGNTELANFGDVRDRILVLQKALNDPRATSDLDFVYGVAKILDPGSVVRESETGMVIDSNSIPAATLGVLNKYTSGQAALDPKLRAGLFDLAKRHYDTRGARVSSILDKYQVLAEKDKIDPADVLPFTKESLTLSEMVQPEIQSGVPAGMKLQVNRKTGEKRLVPQ